MTNPLLRLVAHPLTVVTHVLGQPLRTTPLVSEQRLLLARPGIDRRLTRELGWDLYHCLIDQNRNRVQITGVAFQPQTLRLQGQCSAASKGVVEGGELV